MGVIRFKIWRDLWAQRGRTLQVVLIIAVGAFAIGMIITTRNLVIGGMVDLWRSTSPAAISLWVSPSINEDTLLTLERIKEVEAVEGLATVTIEWRNNSGEVWQAAGLNMRADYKAQHYTMLELSSGKWPHARVMAVGQGGDTGFGVLEGSEIQLRIDDRTYFVSIGGVIYDPVVLPPSFGGPAQFYVTRERFGELTGNRDFNELKAGLSGAFNVDTAIRVVDEMQLKLEKQGIDSGGAAPPQGTRVAESDKHFFQDAMDAIFLVLGVLAVLSLILGLFLVYNTINALVSQQIAQIGVMKTIGASTRQILNIYLLTVLAYGLIALTLALPLGILGGWFLSGFLIASFNADPGGLQVSPPAVGVMVAITLLAPLLAALIPIHKGSKITVNEAINTYGLSAKSNWLERSLAKLERVPRLFLLTVSHTFRHKGRVLLTQISLVLSGLIFMMVVSVQDSVRYTFGDVLFSILRFDVSFTFDDPERILFAEELALAHPDVKAAEMWGFRRADIRPQGKLESEDDAHAVVFGVPLPTQIYGPKMREGRWLRASDRDKVVLNQKLAARLNVGVGDWVSFDFGVQGNADSQVVGLLFDPTITESAHLPRDALLYFLKDVGKAQTIWIQTWRGDAQGELASAARLKDYFEGNQLNLMPQGILGKNTATEVTAAIVGQFSTIFSLLAVMAVVIGVVGSIALSGVLSLNVLERRREIGVMRAIGASSGAISRLCTGEGLILGLLSWLIALPLSIPAGRIMTDAVGNAFGIEFVYHYQITGALFWLALVTVLSIAASWLPAQGAIRVSVEESLAYQ